MKKLRKRIESQTVVTRKSIIARGDNGCMVKIEGVIGIVTTNGYRVNFNPVAVRVIHDALANRQLAHCQAEDGSRITIDGAKRRIANHAWAIGLHRVPLEILSDVAHQRIRPPAKAREHFSPRRLR